MVKVPPVTLTALVPPLRMIGTPSAILESPVAVMLLKVMDVAPWNDSSPAVKVKLPNELAPKADSTLLAVTVRLVLGRVMATAAMSPLKNCEPGISNTPVLPEGSHWTKKLCPPPDSQYRPIMS